MSHGKLMPLHGSGSGSSIATADAKFGINVDAAVISSTSSFFFI
jgi:hypothetical protein